MSTEIPRTPHNVKKFDYSTTPEDEEMGREIWVVVFFALHLSIYVSSMVLIKINGEDKNITLDLTASLIYFFQKAIHVVFLFHCIEYTRHTKL